MNKTKIEWVKNPDGTQGYTWNPITGCLNGCEYCYARKLANGRLRSRYLANKNWDTRTPEGYEGYPNLDPFYPRFWPERIKELEACVAIDDPHYLQRIPKVPRGIFVCDMGELFGDWLPQRWVDDVLSTIKANEIHRFYLLTKQPQNLIKWSPFPENCWVGVTAIGSSEFSKAAYWLARVDAKVRYISAEPLLLPYPIADMTYKILKTVRINWLIIGAQTKPYKPPKIEWVREIVEAADKAGIPVFLKDNLKPLIREAGMSKASWAAREWVQCKYPILRQEMPQEKRFSYE